ncbi:hypothetical protein [Desulforegula conservatrix]|uniref:hypothetical protein n=1 Tax=Desulforegula conservatrix TaxID=153026 RepID=UPI000489673C|nr:hypothetical protein [Desulforegula conservatrix]
MIKRILIVISIVFIAFVAIFSPRLIWEYQTKSILEGLLSSININDFDLTEGGNDGIKKKFFETPIESEVGIIRLKDGSIVKYAFQSHHLNQYDSISFFQFKDEVKIVFGYFCCEVMFGENQHFANWNQLVEFLSTIDGQKP